MIETSVANGIKFRLKGSALTFDEKLKLCRRVLVTEPLKVHHGLVLHWIFRTLERKKNLLHDEQGDRRKSLWCLLEVVTDLEEHLSKMGGISAEMLINIVIPTEDKEVNEKMWILLSTCIESEYLFLNLSKNTHVFTKVISLLIDQFASKIPCKKSLEALLLRLPENDNSNKGDIDGMIISLSQGLDLSNHLRKFLTQNFFTLKIQDKKPPITICEKMSILKDPRLQLGIFLPRLFRSLNDKMSTVDAWKRASNKAKFTFLIGMVEGLQEKEDKGWKVEIFDNYVEVISKLLKMNPVIIEPLVGTYSCSLLFNELKDFSAEFSLLVDIYSKLRLIPKLMAKILIYLAQHPEVGADFDKKSDNDPPNNVLQKIKWYESHQQNISLTFQDVKDLPFEHFSFITPHLDGNEMRKLAEHYVVNPHPDQNIDEDQKLQSSIIDFLETQISTVLSLNRNRSTDVIEELNSLLQGKNSFPKCKAESKAIEELLISYLQLPLEYLEERLSEQMFNLESNELEISALLLSELSKKLLSSSEASNTTYVLSKKLFDSMAKCNFDRISKLNNEEQESIYLLLTGTSGTLKVLHGNKKSLSLWTNHVEKLFYFCIDDSNVTQNTTIDFLTCLCNEYIIFKKAIDVPSIWNKLKKKIQFSLHEKTLLESLFQIPDKDVVHELLSDILSMSMKNENIEEFCGCIGMWQSLFNLRKFPQRFTIMKVLELEIALFYNDKPVVHEDVEASCLITPLRVNFRTYTENEHFFDLWNAVYELMYLVLQRRSTLIITRIPIVLDIVRNMVESLMKSSDQSIKELEEPVLEKLSLCTRRLERLLESFGRNRDDFSRVTPYLVADILSGFQNFKIHTEIRSNIVNGLHWLFKLGDKHSLAFLASSLPLGLTEMFKQLHDDYIKNYKFSGKI
ncbi:unnamed protein product [Lepeophtheirus salmonis]|uniref:(salmon louse) hypothetical protein n=1 Tax=Lepeophtheirus salmonis TaxID=72036 RepID=A0A7R8H6S1_LEPSM|nr:unnamed protein product [Lepeophtheirus salmonis]CAF2902446.1 unnamed protein product [Lepeophtheirus salmonis]